MQSEVSVEGVECKWLQALLLQLPMVHLHSMGTRPRDMAATARATTALVLSVPRLEAIITTVLARARNRRTVGTNRAAAVAEAAPRSLARTEAMAHPLLPLFLALLPERPAGRQTTIAGGLVEVALPSVATRPTTALVALPLHLHPWRCHHQQLQHPCDAPKL